MLSTFTPSAFAINAFDTTAASTEIKTQLDESAEKLTKALGNLENIRKEVIIHPTKVASEEVAQLKEQLRNQSLELLKISAERDAANRAVISKDKELVHLKKQLKAAEFRKEKKGHMSSFKIKIDELQIKLKEKDMENKKKDEIIGKMRLSRKKEQQERKEIIKNMKKAMEIKIDNIEKIYENKMKTTSEVVSSPDSGFQSESSDTSGFISTEASFQSESSCTQCNVNFYENAFNINWIEQYLTMNCRLMAQLLTNREQAMTTGLVEKNRLEEKIRRMEEKQKQLEMEVKEQEMDEQNDKLRKRDIDFLWSLL